MHKFFALVLMLAALVVGGCSPQAAPTITVEEMLPTAALVQATPAPATPQTQSASEFDAARAMEHTRVLAVTIGPRVAGTTGSLAAADYIERQLKSYGYRVTRQPFPFTAWEDRGTSLQVLTAEGRTLEAHAIGGSRGGDLEGEVVIVPGLGDRNDFSKVNVRGKIALVRRGTIPFSVKAANAEQVGASAILVYNDRPGTASVRLGEPVDIPAVFLSGEAGNELLGMLAAAPVRVKLQVDAGELTKTGHNIIAAKQGTSGSTIFVGGHYDSVAAGPGAGDNASGVAVLIELARVMAGRQHHHTLVFAAFDAEEFGLWGSKAYVDSLTDDQLGSARAMLNFDMLGAGTGPLLLGGDGNLALLARASAKELGLDSQNFRLGSNAGSDHESFARRGVDTVFFSRHYDLLHTPEDTVTEIREEFLDEAGRTALRLLERLDALP